MQTSKLIVIGFFAFVLSHFSISPVSAQGDSRNTSCYDRGMRKDCYVRQSYSRLSGNSGYHLIAHWSDGDTTELFIPTKRSGDNTVYAKFNGSEWIPSKFEYCGIETGSVRYVKAIWGSGDSGGTGCIPDFIPNY